MVLAGFSPNDVAATRLAYLGADWHRYAQQEIHLTDKYPADTYLWLCCTALDAKHPILRNNRHPGPGGTDWFPGKNPFRYPVPGRLLRLIVPILLVCIMLVTGLRFVQVVQEQPKTEAENFPKAAVNWLLENKPKGNLFNSYGWGGYLIWRTYPEYRVYIDGRADVYGDAFIYNYISIYRAEPGWDDKLKKQAVQTVLVESNAPLANILRQSLSWRIAFEDKASIIFVRLKQLLKIFRCLQHLGTVLGRSDILKYFGDTGRLNRSEKSSA